MAAPQAWAFQMAFAPQDANRLPPLKDRSMPPSRTACAISTCIPPAEIIDGGRDSPSEEAQTVRLRYTLWVTCRLQMHTIKTTCRAFATIALGLFFSSSLVCKAQEQTHLAGKEAPAQIRHELVILGDDVVQEEWAASLGLVNAPEDLQQIEPGQCIRFGVIATGNGRDVLLRSATFSFELHLGGEVRTFAAEPAVVIKQVKPEGGDFVTQALGAAGVKNPSLSMVSLAASIPRWCLSADVHAESAKVLAKAFLKSGKTVSLNSRVLRLKTFEGARKAHPFTSLDMLDRWVQSYYRAPDPAQLLPGLRIVAADPTARSMHNIMVFFIAAMKKRPEAADDIMRHLPNESAVTRIMPSPSCSVPGMKSNHCCAASSLMRSPVSNP